ncbi:MAG TPA: glycine cleavage system protein GcvH [Candidatus Baltobacteraceae bacterium]|jgi:glycine cleavage system H protein|nr:glycine cleavage system protein GcvH [Candidatus Baltobacteraceae bacterium]
MYPADLKYTKDHEWIKLDGKLGRIGVTDYAQHALGDVVFVELPQVGRALQAAETFGVVESVKAVSDMHCPVSGQVKEVNPALETQPELVNKDCYGAGWFIVIEVQKPKELDALMDAKAYEAFVASEAH